MSRAHRYFAFATLYLAQGAILSFMTALNSIYLLGRGVPLARVGIISAIGMIPFVLKIFLGMLSDRINLLGRGHRLPYIVIGLLLQSAGLVVLPSLDPVGQFGAYSLLVFLTVAGMALYDTCTDGLALDTTPPDEEGTVQGIMVGGRALGIIVVSVIIGLVAEHSWPAVFYTLAGITLAALPLLIGLREPPTPAGRAFHWRAFAALGRRTVLAVALFGTLNSLVAYGANELVNPFLQDEFGIGTSIAGLFTAVWGIGVVLGALLSGRLADRIGRHIAALVAVVVAAGALLALSQVQTLHAAWPAVAFFGLAFGAYETMFFALAMGVCEPGINASMYAILMAVSNIGTAIGMAVAAALADAPVIGYRGAFLVLSASNLIVAASLPLVFDRRPLKAAHV